MTIESFNFYKGINRSKPKIYLDESELYSCEGYDLEYVGMLMSRDPKRQGLLVDGPLLEHPPTVGPPPPPTPPTPPVPWTPPNQAAFWAWFKYNEGLGTAIIDYSPTATNGQLFTNTNDPAIEPNVSYFWGTNPGYGTETAAGTGCRNRRQAPSRDSSYCSMVAFIKPLGYGMFTSTQAVQLGHTSNLNCLIVGWEGASSPHYWKFQYSAGEKTASLAATYGTWYCIYAYSQKGVNNNGLYIKSSGAAWAQALVNQGVATSSNGDQTTVMMFGGTTNPHAMNGGDGLYYALDTSEGIISLSQADDIYENLKSRYDMT